MVCVGHSQQIFFFSYGNGALLSMMGHFQMKRKMTSSDCQHSVSFPSEFRFDPELCGPVAFRIRSPGIPLLLGVLAEKVKPVPKPH